MLVCSSNGAGVYRCTVASVQELGLVWLIWSLTSEYINLMIEWPHFVSFLKVLSHTWTRTGLLQHHKRAFCQGDDKLQNPNSLQTFGSGRAQIIRQNSSSILYFDQTNGNILHCAEAETGILSLFWATIYNLAFVLYQHSQLCLQCHCNHSVNNCNWLNGNRWTTTSPNSRRFFNDNKQLTASNSLRPVYILSLRTNGKTDVQLSHLHTTK